MKTIAPIILFLVIQADVKCQSDEIELSSIELKTAIDMYMDSVNFKIDKKYGYLIVKFEYLRGHDYDRETFQYLNPYRFEIDSFSIQISAYHYKNMILHDPPLSYLFYRDTPVLIYSGLERLQKLAADEEILKKIRKYFGDGKTGAVKHAKHWRIVYRDGKYQVTDLSRKGIQFPY